MPENVNAFQADFQMAEFDSIGSTLLLLLDEASRPMGSRQVLSGLRRNGIEVSESTVARRLRRLDGHGLTRQDGELGRVLTSDGKNRVAVLLRARRGSTDLLRASRVETATDVLNLLRARRAIEPEALNRGAVLASPSQIEFLSDLVESHESPDGTERRSGLQFHRRVTSLTDNPLVKAMLRIVLDASLDRVASTLDTILHDHNVDKSSAEEHCAIIDAISDHDGERAAMLMAQHIERMIREVERLTIRYDDDVLDHIVSER